MDEEFLAAVVGGYEAKTLLVIEPLHLPRYPLLLTLTHRSGSDLSLSLSLSFFSFLSLHFNNSLSLAMHLLLLLSDPANAPHCALSL